MNEIKEEPNLNTTNEVDIYVQDTGGDGQSVLLIHGWPLSGKAWDKQISALSSAGYRVIAYDRRGFGQSEKPDSGFGYDTLADDLARLISVLELHAVTLVGFSMGGGEVARYIAKHGEDKLKAVVFASAVVPMMLKTRDNPEGPLDPYTADKMAGELIADADAFYNQFTKDFFSAHADGEILVSEEERQTALYLCKQADKNAALETMKSFGMTDFREDIQSITVPVLVIQGDADGIVPFEGSGKRTHEAIPASKLQVIVGGPHGINVSHTEEFNTALLDFLKSNT